MAAIGRFNTLPIVKRADFGVYLDGGDEGEILLPNRYLPKGHTHAIGDQLKVFLYLDSEDRPIATTETPKVQVGEFASLKVVDNTSVGLFLDWGLSKDVLLPHSETRRPLKVGDYCLVYLYLDDHTRRITATTHLDRHLDLTPPPYQPGESVDLLVAARTDLGFKAIVNGQHWGLIHNNDVFRFLRQGMRETGYIKEVRDDGKISLSLQPLGDSGRDTLQNLILNKLDEAGGVLPFSDRTPPELIAREFGVSKGNFKKAIGALFRREAIVIYQDRIELP